MTYSVLAAPTTTTSLDSEYISQGTDEAEAAHWAKVLGQPVDDVDFTPDLEDMGLR